MNGLGGASIPSLASSVSGVSSTGLSHGLHNLGMFSSGSTEVASHLVATGGSGWCVSFSFEYTQSLGYIQQRLDFSSLWAAVAGEQTFQTTFISS